MTGKGRAASETLQTLPIFGSYFQRLLWLLKAEHLFYADFCSKGAGSTIYLLCAPSRKPDYNNIKIIMILNNKKNVESFLIQKKKLNLVIRTDPL